ncbi:MAG: hypothetical protein J6R88_04950 [Clostridia bacterium]|nr:hypothetical protein [Clostridia bacterium]
MVDVHSHILPFVDDGCSTLEEALTLLGDHVAQGVKTFILTPHYRKEEYEPSVEELKRVFNDFEKAVAEKFPNVKLYLGEEIFCDMNVYSLLKEGKVIPIGNTNKVLLEFNYTAFTDIADFAYNVMYSGYTPIIAHIERYEYVKRIDQIVEMKENGALIQVNAESLLDPVLRKRIFILIKNGLIDFISSDAHYSRKACAKEAYKIIAKKFSREIADNLFFKNAENLILN